MKRGGQPHGGLAMRRCTELPDFDSITHLERSGSKANSADRFTRRTKGFLPERPRALLTLVLH